MCGASEPRRLSLEVRFDRQPIEGRLYAEEGSFVRPFSGWLGLMAAIQAAGATHEGEDDPQRPRAGVVGATLMRHIH